MEHLDYYVQGWCWAVVAVCFIVLIVQNKRLIRELNYQNEVKKIYKHKLQLADDMAATYKSKYLDLVSRYNKYKTTADYKEQIINDYHNKETCVYMARKYWLKADTIRKALYRWGLKMPR